MRIATGIALLLLAAPIASFSQSYLVKKARKFYKEKDYVKAKETYALAAEEDPENADIWYEYGLTYFSSEIDKGKALDLFQKAMRLSSTDTSLDLLFWTAEAFHYVGNMEEAMSLYERYLARTTTSGGNSPLQQETNRKLEMCRNGMELSRTHYDRYAEVTPLTGELNSFHSDFTSLFSRDGNTVIFTSRRPLLSSKKDWDGQFHEGVFYAEKKNGKWGKVRPLGATESKNGAFNKKSQHVAVVSLSPDGNKLYTYTKSNLWVSRKRKSGGWAQPEKLGPNINIGSYNTSIVVSPDATRLMVASEAQDGYGGRDLYYSYKDENGDWTPLTNLGDEINSSFNDECPHFADNNTVFFSSQGHNSMGGYDVFRMEWTDEGWSLPENMGIPVNSPGDDMFFMYSPKENEGHFSSTRNGGAGHMDMYHVKFGCSGVERTEVKGMFAVDEKAKYFPTSVILRNPETGAKTGEFPVAKDGSFAMSANTESSYDMEIVLAPEDMERNLSQKISIDKQCEEYPLFQIIHLTEESTEEFEVVDAVFHNAFFNVQKEFVDLSAQEVLYAIVSENGLNSYLSRLRETQDPEEFFVNEDQLTMETPTPATTVEEHIEDPKIELNPLFFDYNSATLRPQSRDELEKVKALLRANPDAKVWIHGHTDGNGSNAYNQRLGLERARSARQYLLDQGIPSPRLVIRSYGEEIPMVPNSQNGEDSPTNRQKNRRVELLIKEE